MAGASRAAAYAMAALVPPGRVVGLDVARCLALLGMIVTHVVPAEDENGVALAQQVAGGRASALFAVLAGVSLALMSGGTNPVRGNERRAVSAGLAVRAVLIALLGLLLGSLPVTILVILCYYGVLFLFGLPFLGLGARTLAVLAAAWVVLAPVLSHVVRPHLPAAPVANLTLTAPAHPWRMLIDLDHTIGCAMAVIGLTLVLGRAVPAMAAVLFGAGAMTLSLYSAHVVLRTPEFLPEDDVPTFTAHVLIVLAVGAAYRMARRSGPLERLVTTSANGTRDAVRRLLSSSAPAS
jgi:uncharacterized membrane protein